MVNPPPTMITINLESMKKYNTNGVLKICFHCPNPKLQPKTCMDGSKRRIIKKKTKNLGQPNKTGLPPRVVCSQNLSNSSLFQNSSSTETNVQLVYSMLKFRCFGPPFFIGASKKYFKHTICFAFFIRSNELSQGCGFPLDIFYLPTQPFHNVGKNYF